VRARPTPARSTVVAAAIQMSAPAGSRCTWMVRSVLRKNSAAGWATAEMPLPESATDASRCIPLGSSPSTTVTVSRVHTTAGPGSANPPSTTRHATASR
jgi:hypothetical protein